MLRKIINRLLGRDDDGDVATSGVERDRMIIHPSDNRYDEDRAAGEAADAAIRGAGNTPGGLG